MNYTYFTLCTIGIFSLIMFPLYYNVVSNAIASAISINWTYTKSTTSTDDTSTDTLYLVELKPKT